MISWYIHLHQDGHVSCCSKALGGTLGIPGSLDEFSVGFVALIGAVEVSTPIPNKINPETYDCIDLWNKYHKIIWKGKQVPSSILQLKRDGINKHPPDHIIPYICHQTGTSLLSHGPNSANPTQLLQGFQTSKAGSKRCRMVSDHGTKRTKKARLKSVGTSHMGLHVGNM